MKRAERACAITQILTNHPNKDYSLGYFAEMFSCAKSSVSEDLHSVRSAVDRIGAGYIETTAGAKGGVRFVPYISKELAKKGLLEFKEAIEEKDRIVGGRFIYTTDLMFSPKYVSLAADIFAKKFASIEADMIITVETRGIGVAMLTAKLLNLPLVVIGRETRVADGSTVSINYFAGSTERIQKMSVSKRAIKQGSKAIIIDDLMRDGGSVKGIEDMLAEFDSKAVGVGVVMVAATKDPKMVRDYFPIMVLDDTSGSYQVNINPEIIE